MTLPPPAMRDFVGRATMTLYFTVCATLKAATTVAAVGNADWTVPRLIDIGASITALGFMVVVVMTTVARLPPVKTARGIEPRISALIGCFATVTLIAVPRIEVAPQLEVMADLITIVGFVLCIWCLWWLGRSFSILAQARVLVTAGPYQIVRHPLYACEAIVLLSIILRNPTWPTVGVGMIVVAFQYRRIVNEEKVLRASFPEYQEYAQRVPMLLPRPYNQPLPVSDLHQLGGVSATRSIAPSTPTAQKRPD